MSRSIGLSAYHALSHRLSSDAGSDTTADRPDGELIWAHATSDTRFSALCDLGLRLRTMRPDLRLLVTVQTSRFREPPEPLNGCDHIVLLDADSPAMARAFLSDWRPDLCLWTGGNLMPNLIEAASDHGLSMVLLDVTETEIPNRRRAWLPDATRRTLNCFDVILANTDEAVSVIRRLGVTGPKLSVSDRLRNSATPPPCSDEDLVEITRDVASRPVWLAAHLRADEFDAVLSAHSAALRLVHRLLLVIVTETTANADLLKRKISDSGLRSVDWDTGGAIEENTQIVVSRDEDNLGLWYRVAPLTLMGCSMSPDATGSNPLEAAALGSAVLYGPHVSTHVESYARLAAAGAARNVRDGDSLGSAVVQLISPDHAAAMALAGWEVVTEGADLTDNLVDLIQDLLDLREAGNARA